MKNGIPNQACSIRPDFRMAGGSTQIEVQRNELDCSPQNARSPEIPARRCVACRVAAVPGLPNECPAACHGSHHWPLPARWPLTPGRAMCWGSQETLLAVMGRQIEFGRECHRGRRMVRSPSVKTVLPMTAAPTDEPHNTNRPRSLVIPTVRSLDRSPSPGGGRSRRCLEVTSRLRKRSHRLRPGYA